MQEHMHTVERPRSMSDLWFRSMCLTGSVSDSDLCLEDTESARRRCRVVSVYVVDLNLSPATPRLGGRLSHVTLYIQTGDTLHYNLYKYIYLYLINIRYLSIDRVFSIYRFRFRSDISDTVSISFPSCRKTYM
jgi:hypothetical protein